MEIKIDTKNDSVEDIKKMISFLQKFIEETPSYGSYGSSNHDPNDDFTIPATSMFDSEPKITEDKSNDRYRIIEY